MNDTPPTVIVPVRAVIDVLEATVKLNDPLPLLLSAVVMMIHDAPLPAVQGHPAAVAIETTPEPPAAGRVADGGCNVMLHVGDDGGAGAGEGEGAGPVAAVPAWFNVSVAPPAVTVAVREAPVFGATVKLTMLAPVPDVGDTAIHDWLTVTTHAQPAGVLIVMVPDPPAAAN